MKIPIFRGKTVKSKKWVYGNLQTNSINDTFIGLLDCGEGDYGFLENVLRETIGQSIHKRDKNNKEIFTGDILMHINKNRKKEYFKVIYSVENFSFYFTALSNNGYFLPIEQFEDWEIEIIGNIYDNPELIENYNPKYEALIRKLEKEKQEIEEKINSEKDSKFALFYKTVKFHLNSLEKEIVNFKG